MNRRSFLSALGKLFGGVAASQATGPLSAAEVVGIKKDVDEQISEYEWDDDETEDAATAEIDPHSYPIGRCVSLLGGSFSDSTMPADWMNAPVYKPRYARWTCRYCGNIWTVRRSTCPTCGGQRKE